MARSALGTAMEETKAVGEMARNFLRQEACSGHGKKRVQSAATQTRRKRELHCSKGRPCKEYVREEARKRSCTAVLEEEGSVVERVDSFPREEACSGHGKKRARRVMTRTRRKRGLHLPKGVMQGARPRGGKKACPAQMRRKRGAVGERAESFSCARDTFGARQEARPARYDMSAKEAGRFGIR